MSPRRASSRRRHISIEFSPTALPLGGLWECAAHQRLLCVARLAQGFYVRKGYVGSEHIRWTDHIRVAERLRQSVHKPADLIPDSLGCGCRKFLLIDAALGMPPFSSPFVHPRGAFHHDSQGVDGVLSCGRLVANEHAVRMR